jgi:hypothetical protein
MFEIVFKKRYGGIRAFFRQDKGESIEKIVNAVCGC